MDYVFDVIFGLILAVFRQIKPDCKLKKWQENLLIAFSILLSIFSIGCFIAGVHLLGTASAKRTAGIILLSVGIFLILLHCIAYAVLIGKHFKSEAEKTDNGKN